MIARRSAEELRDFPLQSKEVDVRVLAKGLFILGVAAFLASAVAVGTALGDVLWRACVALMLIDLVLVHLWPRTGLADAEQRRSVAAGA